MAAFDATAIVRTYNSERTLERTLSSLRTQSVRVEVVVVDSGSSDATLHIAERADHVVGISQRDFTYGRALNRGASHAAAPVLVALSSHCWLPRNDWVERCCRHLQAGAAAAFGAHRDGSGRPIAGTLTVDHPAALAWPSWGMTNHASAWSAEVWRRHPFDETLAACEDLEWGWRVTGAGGWLVADPGLVVDAGHRRSVGSRRYFERLRREIAAVDDFRGVPGLSAIEAAREWVRELPRDPFLTDARPLGRTRLIEVAARWLATRGRGVRP